MFTRKVSEKSEDQARRGWKRSRFCRDGFYFCFTLFFPLKEPLAWERLRIREKAQSRLISMDFDPKKKTKKNTIHELNLCIFSPGIQVPGDQTPRAFCKILNDMFYTGESTKCFFFLSLPINKFSSSRWLVGDLEGGLVTNTAEVGSK